MSDGVSPSPTVHLSAAPHRAPAARAASGSDKAPTPPDSGRSGSSKACPPSPPDGPSMPAGPPRTEQGVRTSPPWACPRAARLFALCPGHVRVAERFGGG
eukprot:gene11506-9989_t